MCWFMTSPPISSSLSRQTGLSSPSVTAGSTWSHLFRGLCAHTALRWGADLSRRELRTPVCHVSLFTSLVLQALCKDFWLFVEQSSLGSYWLIAEVCAECLSRVEGRGFPGVQGFRPRTPEARGPGSSPGQGAEVPHAAAQLGQKKINK